MRKKRLMFYIALVAALALPTGLLAQSEKGGLFNSNPAYQDSKNVSLLNQNRETKDWSDGLGNQGFNQELPLGSGVLMLIAAGAGYAVLKRKQEKN